MKLKVVIDANNRILGVAHLPEVKPGEPPALTVHPVLRTGHREFEVDVPETHLDRKPREHLRALQVDPKGRVTYRVGSA